MMCYGPLNDVTNLRHMVTYISPITRIDNVQDTEQSQRVRQVQRIIARERIRLTGLGQVRVD